MNQFCKQYRKRLRCIFVAAIVLCHFLPAYGQDDCSAAKNITLAGGGYGIGLVTSSVIGITSATLQAGETFSPTNSAAGQTQKSIWYKFNLPTSRSVTIRLAQNTPSIASGDVGFAVYKTTSCTPGNSDLSTQLSPVTVFGTTTSSCLQPGDYLIQVAAKSSADGSVYIQIQTGLPASSPYDHTNEAYDFGSLTTGVATISFPVDCQSTDNASEVCTSLPNYTEYTKSTWHVFTTPAYSDYISLILANQTLAAGQTYGFNLYKGDVRSSTGTLMNGCKAITSNAYKSAQKTFTCSDLDPNTTYSIQVFYHQNFTDNVQLSLVTGGTAPTAAPIPIAPLSASNTAALTPTASGITIVLSDYLACNSRHAVTNCPPTLPPSGISDSNRNFNLSSFFSLTLNGSSSLNLSANPSCGPPLLIRLYKQNLTANCSGLTIANLIREAIGSTSLSCLAAGSYVVQVSGTDSSIENTYEYGTLTNGSAPLCLLSNFGSSFNLNITATTPSAFTQNIDSTLCSGQSFTLSNGIIVTTSNTYRDTLRTVNGCDSIIRVLNLNFKNKTVQSSSVEICLGTSYKLPSGKLISDAGTYNDTLHYASGCDSLINIVTVSVKPVLHQLIDTSICENGSYRLPSGILITASGDYLDTVRYNSGCDSLITQLHLTVNNTSIQKNTITICAGKAYTLPWGITVTDEGEYRDTLHYTTGCDSVIRIIELVVNASIMLTKSAAICEGSYYTLPWGLTVNTPDVYADTMRYVSGCDSLITQVTLTVNNSTTQTTNVTICSTQSYTLPWGTIVNTSGNYRDTLRYGNGCDSIIRVVQLTVSTPITKNITANICEGSSYTLPDGVVVNSSGNYLDTIRNTSGCDSIIYRITITENKRLIDAAADSVCAGQPYPLPSGAIVYGPGIYHDTIRYAFGCDSLITTVILRQSIPVIQQISAAICEGHSYTLPWGTTASWEGLYSDTLHNRFGCDSLIRRVQLTVFSPSRNSITQNTCAGQAFTLPSGKQVMPPGIFSDTLHSVSGCDSIIFDVHLNTIAPTTRSTNAAICSGSWFTLPSGTTVSQAGTYADTIRSSSGCDSVYETVHLTVIAALQKSFSASICQGSGYTLPSGKIINTAGVYNDTIFSVSGCDSLITTVTLSIRTVIKQSSSILLCSNQSYTLPWGMVVNSPGIYSDTLHYPAGCDSLIRTITINSLLARTTTASVKICQGETYQLPSGSLVTASGIYTDTLRTNNGCDSIIRIIDLTVSTKPLLTVSKSNDISCSLGSAKLQASGGAQYSWSPSTGLDRTDISTPLAAPSTTTTYHVITHSVDGCTAEDSIQVLVNNNNAQDGYLVPSAFSPNGDGLNDYFGIKHWGNVSDLHFSIYDRWGSVVFYTNNISQSWDGTYKGLQQPTGVYVYIIEAKTPCGNVTRKGTVTLIR